MPILSLLMAPNANGNVHRSHRRKKTSIAARRKRIPIITSSLSIEIGKPLNISAKHTKELGMIRPSVTKSSTRFLNTQRSKKIGDFKATSQKASSRINRKRNRAMARFPLPIKYSIGQYQVRESSLSMCLLA